MTTPPRVVLLTAVYNEEASLPRYVEAVREVLFSRTDCRYEVLFVDDGSSDTTWSVIRKTCAEEPRFQGLRLSRNFGGHLAEHAGFTHADADAVITLACDLQDPPAVAVELVERWRAGAKIVWAKRRSRKDSPWRVLGSRTFYALLRRFAMPRGSRFATGGFFLLDRQVVEAVRQFQEHNRVNFALVAWTGFDQDVVEYDRAKRLAGKSGWNLGRMFKTAYDAFIGFSYLPIRLITTIGLLVSFLSMLFGAWLVYNWWTSRLLPGWTSTLLLISMLSGLQFLLIGICGEYLYRIYSEVVRRPLVLISDRTKGDGP